VISNDALFGYSKTALNAEICEVPYQNEKNSNAMLCVWAKSCNVCKTDPLFKITKLWFLIGLAQ